MTRRPDTPRYQEELALLRDLALQDASGESGFWDDNGTPAPWPDDIDEWRPTSSAPITPKPGEPPF